MKPALIFDMDGVIVDSNPFHKLAWQQFCKQHGLALSDDALRQNVYGKTNEDVIPYIFKKKMEKAEIERYTREKETIFQELFRPHISPTQGLQEFVPHATQWFSKLAIGTSAPPMNVGFTLDTLGIRQYFPIIVDDTQISKGKPDPEIYLTVAQKLSYLPKDCVVIEDSLAGIESAKRAGMRVIGITSTHSRQEFENEVDLVIDDFCDFDHQLNSFLGVTA